jgi:hypothetical protein
MVEIILPDTDKDLKKSIFVGDNKDIDRNSFYNSLPKNCSGIWIIACPIYTKNSFKLKKFYHEFTIEEGILKETKSSYESGEKYSGTIYGDLNYLKNICCFSPLNTHIYEGDFYYKILLN